MPTPTAPNIALALWHQRPGDRAPAVGEASARQWLDQRAINDVERSALRSAALGLADGTELSRLDDAQLKDHLSAALIGGRLYAAATSAVVLRQLTPTAKLAATVIAAPAVAASSPRAAPEAAPAPAAETTFGPDLDVAAQVAALVQAAQDGVPFCEECAKAAAKRALAEETA
jgi:hypothetical protein